MIFVTVGTTKYEKLVKVMDELALNLKEPVIIQIGIGQYKPINCEFFEYRSTLDSYFKKASIVVGSGGVGTVFEMLQLGKRFVAVSNTDIPDRHQDQILEKLSDESYLFWCRDLKDLGSAIEQARTYPFKKYVQPECWIDQIIMDFIK